MVDMAKEVIIKEDEPGWSVFVNELDDSFYGSDANVWITSEDDRLALELFVCESISGKIHSARLAVTPLGRSLWMFVDMLSRGDTKTKMLGEKLNEPIPFEGRDDLSILTAYRETLSRALAYCDAVIDEHKHWQE